MVARKRAGAETASPELIQRSVAVILATTRGGAPTAVLGGAILGFILVPAAGWTRFLAWYAVFVVAMLGRQNYFRVLLERDGPSERTLFRIAVVAALTGWLAPAAVPLFQHFLSLQDIGVLTVMMVSWVALAVSVLSVQPRVCAAYVAACFATVYLGWIPHAGLRDLLLIGVAMVIGAPMLTRLARSVHRQLRDTVDASQQNAVLVEQLRDALQMQQETQRARSRFLGAASHDLRQPVQALLFLADIFRKSTDPARRDAMAQQIVRTGESIDGMFRHLVDFAQIDAGTMKAVLQPVQLERLVTGAVTGFAEKCASRGLHFRLEMDDAAAAVSADPVLLERMLRNFLDNACKYSLHGEIVLRVQREGDEALLSVSDQGVGMAADDLAQACNAFFRGRSASIAEAEGIGLGLAISKHMADLMHSRLEIASQAGNGTRVGVRLPLVSQEPAVAPPAPTQRGAPLQGLLVAVVENDRLAREALCAWLREAGARVAQGSSGEQLEEALRAEGEPPDFVVADYRLASGTGVEVLEALQRAHGPLPALVISGEPDIAERGLPYPVLQKPVTPDRLLEALHAALPRRSEPVALDEQA